MSAHHDHSEHGCRHSGHGKAGADPAKDLAPAAVQQEASDPAGTQYTCPMHPEIVRDAPGNCPICGMALEPVMPALDDGETPEPSPSSADGSGGHCHCR